MEGSDHLFETDLKSFRISGWGLKDASLQRRMLGKPEGGGCDRIINPSMRILVLGFMTLILGSMTLILVSLAGAAHPLPLETICQEDLLARDPGLVAAQIVDMGHPGGGPSILISIVISEVGFALGQAEELIPVRLQVEKVRGLDPSQVRRLLGENRTLGEIKAEIEGAEGCYIHRGHLRFGCAHYLLEDLSLTSEELNTTLEADLMEPVWGWCAIPEAPEPGLELAGRIFVQTRLTNESDLANGSDNANGSEIGAGSLVIFSGPYAGSYALILTSSVGPGWGMAACPGWTGGLAGGRSAGGGLAGSELFAACWTGERLRSPGLGSPGPRATRVEAILFSPESAGMSPLLRSGCLGGCCPFQPEPCDPILLDLGCRDLGPLSPGWDGCGVCGGGFAGMGDLPDRLYQLSWF